MPVAMGRTAVSVRGAELDIHEVKDAVTNAALGNDLLGKLTHSFYRTLEHHGLDALFVIKVGVHGRHGEVMVRVLDTRQPLREVAFMMIIDVREIGHTRALDIAPFGALLNVRSENIAHSLASSSVAAFLDEFIEVCGELSIE